MRCARDAPRKTTRIVQVTQAHGWLGAQSHARLGHTHDVFERQHAKVLADGEKVFVATAEAFS